VTGAVKGRKGKFWDALAWSKVIEWGRQLKNTASYILLNVLESVGKSRAAVNRLSLLFRVAGPTLLVLDITITTVVVMKAHPEQRGRVMAREYTGLGVGVAGGAGGAWAGCVAFAALGSPSLVLPVIGEVAEGTLCVVGGILGGIGVGWVGREAGKTAGEAVYDFVTTFRWE
jgi:hypothetical protein